jgi:hypothetical protein
MSTPRRRQGDCGSALPDAAAARTVQPAAAGAWRRRHWPMALWSLATVAVGVPATATATATATCTFCRRHNAWLEQLAQATRGQPLRVIGVAGDGDAARVRDYLRQQGWRFAVTLGAEPLRASLTARGVVPLTCVLDRAARLREVIPGEMSEPDVLGLARWARVA